MLATRAEMPSRDINYANRPVPESSWERRGHVPPDDSGKNVGQAAGGRRHFDGRMPIILGR
jgi:hypothetical protein